MCANIAYLYGNEVGKIIMEHLLEQEMTLSQVEEAQDLSRESVKKNHKGCYWLNLYLSI